MRTCGLVSHGSPPSLVQPCGAFGVERLRKVVQSDCDFEDKEKVLFNRFSTASSQGDACNGPERVPVAEIRRPGLAGSVFLCCPCVHAVVLLIDTTVVDVGFCLIPGPPAPLKACHPAPAAALNVLAGFRPDCCAAALPCHSTQ